MPVGSTSDTDRPQSSFCLALRAAVRQSPLRQSEIATRAGISLRTLQRFLSNGKPPDPMLQNKLLSVCDVVPATSLLAAQLGYDHLIGSPFGAYADTLIPLIYGMLKDAHDEHVLPIDPRWAALEARMIKLRWDDAIRRREEAAIAGLNNY